MNQEQVGIKTPEFVSLQFQPAGLGSRAAAFMIDQLILMVANIAIIAILLFFVVGEPTVMGSDMSTIIIAIAVIVLFIINYGYFIVMEFFSGGKTIGKRIVGIRVIQDNGHSITLLSSFIRNFLRLVDALPTSYLVGILMIFFHSQHKRLGDLVAGTIVVHERKAKGKKKLSPIEKEIARRGLSVEDLELGEWTLKSIEMKDWNLVKTYANRLLQLPPGERGQLTRQMADILFPKLGIDTVGKTIEQLEDTLLVIYLHLQQEWEFEL